MTLCPRQLKIMLCMILLFAQGVLNQTIRNIESSSAEPTFEQAKKMDPDLFKAFSMGHLPLAIDWLLMKFLGDAGSGGSASPGTHAGYYFDLDLITDLDPAFFEAYYTGGNILSVVSKDVQGAKDLLLKGNTFIREDLPNYPRKFKKQFWGDVWSVPILLAYVYLFDLNDMPHAAEAFHHAAEFPGAPAYVVRLKARLEKPGGEYEVGVKLLEFMIAGAKEERILQELEKKKWNLQISYSVFQINQAFQGFLNSQPRKRSSETASRVQLENFWTDFLKANPTASHDPWGGLIRLDRDGRVASTTPHEPVFGLKF